MASQNDRDVSLPPDHTARMPKRGRNALSAYLTIVAFLQVIQNDVAAFGIYPTPVRLAYPRTAVVHLKSTTEATDQRDHSIDEKVLKELDRCESGLMARKVLERALGVSGSSVVESSSGDAALYGSIRIPRGASDRGISDGDLAIQTKVRNKKYGILELVELNGDRDADRASLALLSLTVGSTASALVANQNLPGPEILRFLVVWVLCFCPFAFVGYGIATPDKLQALLISVQRSVFPRYRRRMVQHEAGHFLMGHLLGLPIKGYATNAVKNAVEFYPLSDPEVGRERAALLGFDRLSNPRYESSVADSPKEKEVPFYSKEGRGAEIVENQSVFRKDKNYTDNPFLRLPSQNEPLNSWPYRGFDHEMVDKLVVVSVAGVCAEILAYGNAEGGYADFSQLKQIFKSAEPELNDRDQENRVRFAIGYTMSQLRGHLGALDDLAEVMENEGSVAECVLAIESCSNVSGHDGILGDYERRRRDRLRSDDVGLLERVMLDEKSADTEEDQLIEGRGGGYRKEGLQLTGDDPLYAAVAVATAFLLWAAAGGLSLH